MLCKLLCNLPVLFPQHYATPCSPALFPAHLTLGIRRSRRHVSFPRSPKPWFSLFSRNNLETIGSSFSARAMQIHKRSICCCLVVIPAGRWSSGRMYLPVCFRNRQAELVLGWPIGGKYFFSPRPRSKRLVK